MEAWKNLTGVILESYFAESKHSLAIFFMVDALLLKIKHMLSGSLFTSFGGGGGGIFLKVALTTLEDNFPSRKDEERREGETLGPFRGVGLGPRLHLNVPVACSLTVGVKALPDLPEARGVQAPLSWFAGAVHGADHEA